MSFTVIGNDNGFLPEAFVATSLPLLPGQRADILVDFSDRLVGDVLTLVNVGPDALYQTSSQPPANRFTTGLVMQFHVSVNDSNSTLRELSDYDEEAEDFSPEFHPLSPKHITSPVSLRERREDLDSDGVDDDCYAVNEEIAQVRMEQGVDSFGRPVFIVNNGSFGDDVGLFFPTGRPVIIDFINYTPDTQPMHVHITDFKVCGRQSIAAGPESGWILPSGLDLGRRDTVAAPSGQVTRVSARFSVQGTFLLHSTILEQGTISLICYLSLLCLPPLLLPLSKGEIKVSFQICRGL